MHSQSKVRHGGRLRTAAHDFRIPLQHWLDLSTGINPIGWSVPNVPADVWRRLPEDDDGLNMASLAYFSGVQVLPIAGSQAAIQAIPQLYGPRRRVGILSPCYAEHEQAWTNAGHVVEAIDYADAALAVSHYDVIILTNPNNPTGRIVEANTLREWHTNLAARGGLLVVDEAFIDADPTHSIISLAHQTGLVVLRSLGKFFGLAGIRCGFVAAEQSLLEKLGQRLGPWAVSHPARWIAQRALADRGWQADASHHLHIASERLSTLLTRHGLPSRSGCAFFRWVRHAEPEALFQAFAQQAVLIRSFPEHGGLRFGLPHTKNDWKKLELALQEVMG